jgi:protein-S-isoprenylcysteine O-methyltransferase Ste14
MTGTEDKRQRRMGSLLVASQFGLILLLADQAAPAFLDRSAPIGAWPLAAAGIALGAWALVANRPGNFNIRPAPRPGGRLVGDGPYRWIRHPMYSSVLTCACACAWAAASPWGWLFTLTLAAVLGFKATLEERWMVSVHPDYKSYQARTHRFIPGIL